MPECIFLVGVPTSGKTTYAEKQNAYIVGRDKTRHKIYGQITNYAIMNEYLVTEEFNKELDMAIKLDLTVVIDNQNLRMKYITPIMDRLPAHYGVKFKEFPIPLWKAFLRNCWRYLHTKRWIPMSYMKTSIKNYKNFTRGKEYLVYERHALRT